MFSLHLDNFNYHFQYWDLWRDNSAVSTQDKYNSRSYGWCRSFCCRNLHQCLDWRSGRDQQSFYHRLIWWQRGCSRSGATPSAWATVPCSRLCFWCSKISTLSAGPTPTTLLAHKLLFLLMMMVPAACPEHCCLWCCNPPTRTWRRSPPRLATAAWRRHWCCRRRIH